MSKWNLKDIFKTKDDFYKAIDSCNLEVEALCKYQGKLIDNVNEFFTLYEKALTNLESIIVYGYMNYHLDMSNNEATEDFMSVQVLESNAKGSLAWLLPEVITYDKADLLSKFTDENMKKYSHTIEQMFSNKDHTLSEVEERIIVGLEKAREDMVNTYQALTITDRKSITVKISTGDIEVTSGNYTKLLSDLEKQDDRRIVFEGYYQYYADHANSIASLYNSIISINSRIAKLRGYKSSLEARLNSQNIPIDVYKSLIKNVKNSCKELQKFYKYREKELGIDEIHTYDRMRKIFSTDKEYTYEEGLNLCFEAAKSASDEYQDLVKHVLQDGWVDAYPDDNKYGGAYSGGTYNSHPYILHNYNGTLNSVYTLMHEAGHSVHTYLAATNQDPLNASYSIYVAEIASTFAECILTDYLLNNETDETVKKTLVEENILGISSTFYRQTLFAEFEYKTHELVDNGKALTSEVLCGIMNELYLEYYGINLDSEKLKEFVWIYIGHFYFSPFYVYQYSTCITASFQIYDKYINSKEEGLDILYSIMKKGGSEFANDILLNSGIDLTKDETYQGITNYLKAQMDKIM